MIKNKNQETWSGIKAGWLAGQTNIWLISNAYFPHLLDSVCLVEASKEAIVSCGYEKNDVGCRLWKSYKLFGSNTKIYFLSLPKSEKLYFHHFKCRKPKAGFNVVLLWLNTTHLLLHIKTVLFSFSQVHLPVARHLLLQQSLHLLPLLTALSLPDTDPGSDDTLPSPTCHSSSHSMAARAGAMPSMTLPVPS